MQISLMTVTLFVKMNLIHFQILLQVAWSIFASSSTDLIINSTTGEIDLQASLSGTYSITFTTSICGITRTRTVTIHSAVNVDAGADVEVCGIAQVTLTASGANSYEWYLSSDLTFHYQQIIPISLIGHL